MLDQKINRRGFAVDAPLAEAGEKIVEARLDAINREVAELTGGEITSIGQVARIEAFVAARGHNISGLGKRNVAAVLARGEPTEDVERLLRLRQEGGKASAAKLGSLLAGADDGRLHGTMIFHKAATGRWAGAGFQPHNLSRTAPEDQDAAIAAVLSGDLDRVTALGPPLDVVASLSRSLIAAAPGCDLISGDFSAIESRLTAWYAGEEWKLDAYRRFDETGDPAHEPYCVNASRVLGRSVTPDDEEGRQLGKLLDLAFGFGGGAGAFKRIAPDAGFSDDEIERFKNQYRAAHPATCRFWLQLYRTLKRVVRTGEPAVRGNIGAEMRAGNLYMRLPSGRTIVYPEARVAPGQYGDEIAFKDNGLGKWETVQEWHGTFVENLVSGTARDLLAAAMLRVEAAGYPIVLHVHDELVAEIPEGFGSTEEFSRLISELPPWAEGLPFAAKVSRRKRYAKTAAAKNVGESRPLERARDAETDDCPADRTPASMPDDLTVPNFLNRTGAPIPPAATATVKSVTLVAADLIVPPILDAPELSIVPDLPPSEPDALDEIIGGTACGNGTDGRLWSTPIVAEVLPGTAKFEAILASLSPKDRAVVYPTEAPLGCAARGWPVFPVPPGTARSYKSGKHNGGALWGHTLDPDEIRRDWARWPDGIVTGAASGLFVIDADTFAGHDVDGLASIAALEERYGKLPDTLMTETPSGGVHRYFKHPGNGLKIKKLSFRDRAGRRPARRRRHDRRAA